ncbi:uncharacterized protein LOC105909759 isoform X2 [Clupea harengus]|uniref:Uncharacterized protein LOC105909759 isoform X2 n=1 Tax=Clupea harengus TaxID=7950 RepID=A0A6P8G2K8_CLUHA|nr:uncharacterized protein LOC105909759 isoform X2 [Clupea harengus]
MNLGERRPNKWWTETDTFAMLTLIEQLDLVHELDKKRQRNDSHFRRLRHSLAKRHIHFTVNQIRNRWKSLKHKYRKIKTASYRSPAARLSAMESFRYFRMLDRMLAHRPKADTPEEGSTGGHDMVVLTPSDLEDHTDSDVTPAPWHDPLIPKLESDDEVKPDPDETPSLDEPGWAVNGMDEVMTLGLSGEYLGSVKAEPIPSSSLHNLEGAREPTSCSSEEFQGTCEDTSSLILQQLTILNHQLSEQLAEQRAFHCSMLGMMDRQIEVLEQLSSFTRSQQEAKAANTTVTATATVSNVTDDDCLSRRVHDVLLRMEKRNVGQPLSLETPPTPCLSKPSPSAEHPAPPSWTVSLLESSTRQESSGLADTDSEAGPKEEALVASADVDTPGLAKDSQPERQSPSPKKSALFNGLLDSCQDQ